MKNLFGLKKTYDLIRIGRNNDGGYLVEKKSLYNSEFLVGMGLYDDWTFEKDFVSINKVGVHVYDHTVDKLFWRTYYQHIFLALRHKLHKKPLKRIFKYFQYLFFFGNKKHYKECIGGETTLKKVLSRINTYPIFLKIDIEGSEYQILDELVLHANIISGLVIEFHDINIFFDKIYKFVQDFDLKLVHIHGNNFGGQSLLGYPLVMEMTFSKNPIPINEEGPSFPHPLDMVNDINANELNLDFS